MIYYLPLSIYYLTLSNNLINMMAYCMGANPYGILKSGYRYAQAVLLVQGSTWKSSYT